MEHLPANWKEQSKERQKHYRQFLNKVELRKTLKLLPALHEGAVAKIH